MKALLLIATAAIASSSALSPYRADTTTARTPQTSTCVTPIGACRVICEFGLAPDPPGACFVGCTCNDGPTTTTTPTPTSTCATPVGACDVFCEFGVAPDPPGTCFEGCTCNPAPEPEPCPVLQTLVSCETQCGDRGIMPNDPAERCPTCKCNESPQLTTTTGGPGTTCPTPVATCNVFCPHGVAPDPPGACVVGCKCNPAPEPEPCPVINTLVSCETQCGDRGIMPTDQAERCPTCKCNLLVQTTSLPPTGRCPRVPSGTFGTCVEACRPGSCAKGQLCCSNGCGNTCQDAVTDTPSNKWKCPSRWSISKGGSSCADGDDGQCSGFKICCPFRLHSYKCVQPVVIMRMRQYGK